MMPGRCDDEPGGGIAMQRLGQMQRCYGDLRKKWRFPDSRPGHEAGEPTLRAGQERDGRLLVTAGAAQLSDLPSGGGRDEYAIREGRLRDGRQNIGGERKSTRVNSSD